MGEDDNSGTSRREWLTLGFILLVALCLRVAHLQQIAANDPFFLQPSVDGRIYDFWARQIVAGDWMGEELFVMGPLYPYWIALVYGAFGESLAILKSVQALLGVVTCGLVWMLGRLYFGPRVGLIAAAMAAGYEMLIFYGGTVMVVNVQVPLILCVLILTRLALRSPAPARWLAVGVVVGLSGLARQTALIYALMMVGWILIGLRDALPAARRWLLVGGLMLGIALVIAPVTIRNRVVTGEFILVNAAGAAILYMGNGPQANGSWSMPPFPGIRIDDPYSLVNSFWQYAERDTGGPLSARAMNAYWTRRTIDSVIADPLRWLRLEGRKLALFLNAYEIPGNRYAELSAEFSWVQRLPLLGFGVVAPLALFGLYESRRRWKQNIPLYAMLLSYVISALAFYVISRLRMPAAAVLMIFSAHGLAQIYEAARLWDRRRLLVAGAVVMAAALFVHLPPLRHSLHMPYYNLGYSYALQEQWDEALAAYTKSLAIREDAQTREAVARAYEGSGRLAEAIDAWRHVLSSSEDTLDRERAIRAKARLDELGVVD